MPSAFSALATGCPPEIVVGRDSGSATSDALASDDALVSETVWVISQSSPCRKGCDRHVMDAVSLSIAYRMLSSYFLPHPRRVVQSSPSRELLRSRFGHP